jgi:hypothetical protein
MSNIITFNSATTPPPSYLVKRRLAVDPDVAGSYTTIGTPVFNAGTNKWQIVDNTIAFNTLYVYKAESQCADGSRPSAFYQFANFNCPSVTITPQSNSIDYSFTPVGGQVSQYIVELYDSTETTLISSNTYVPAFPSPITGTFTGLTTNTTYKVRVKMNIGLIQNACTFIPTATTVSAGVINVLFGGLPVTQGANSANGTITGMVGTTVNVRLLMGGTDAAAVLNYNIDGTTGTINNSSSVFFIPKVLTTGSINWSISIITAASSQSGSIQLV